MLPKLKAIIFDFDGLILDTEYPYFDSWREVYASFGLTLALPEWSALIGKGAEVLARTPYEDIENKVGRTLDHNLIRAKRRAVFDRLMACETVLRGVEALIADAQRNSLLLAVASSSPRDWVTGYIERLELGSLFPVICCGDEVQRLKPAPDIYLAALRSLGIGAEEAVALEDSAHGIAAAKAAGLLCIAVPNRITVTTDLGGADIQVKSLEHLSVERLLSYHAVRFSP
ncbi:MAG: HAD-IA family hydrolase [Armatimonadota bacterium]